MAKRKSFFGSLTAFKPIRAKVMRMTALTVQTRGGFRHAWIVAAVCFIPVAEAGGGKAVIREKAVIRDSCLVIRDPEPKQVARPLLQGSLLYGYVACQKTS